MRSSSASRRVRRWFRPLLVQLEGRVVPSFVAAHAFDVGDRPQSVATGDFNGDGVLDLAVANAGSNNVSVLLGAGDGAFGAAQNFSAGRSPRSVAVGDFDGNGVLDLAVANDLSANVSVGLGNGDGTFQAVGPFSAESGPSSVAVGDFNGDGALDLAVANEGSNNVSVLLGNGNGTFRPLLPPVLVESLPQSVATGDFDGDGVLDLAVANAPFGRPGTVSVLLGNGDGTFRPLLPPVPVGNKPLSVAVGDFDGDGALDLAVANAFDNSVSIRLGNGDGRFRNKPDVPTETGPRFVATGDFDGDGVLDLAVANSFSNTVSVRLGNGDGTFRAPLGFNFNTGSGPRSVAVGDLNGDGVLDLAVVNYGYPPFLRDRCVSVLLGTGDGTFRATRNFSADSGPTSVATGDFNGDGVLDLAVANFLNNNVSVLLGTGDGAFLNAPNVPVESAPRSVATGDFNGDGAFDLAVANAISNNVSVRLGNGNGTFRDGGHFSVGFTPSSVATDDFNGDGVLDLAVANAGSNNVSVLLGNGDGTFGPPGNFPVEGEARSVAVGDFNGDGALDLAVAHRTTPSTGEPGGVSVLLGNGDGTFRPLRDFPVGGAALSVAVGDFNDDGILDLAVAHLTHPSPPGEPEPGGVSVLLGNGDGTFQARRNFPVGSEPTSVATGDFDGDGVLDLVATAGTVRVLLGNGDGTFRTPPVNYAAGSVPASVAVADFNGDGWPDLAVANERSTDVSILLNDGIWTGPGGAPGGGRSPRGGTPLPALEGFPAEALVSRPATGTLLVQPLRTQPGSPEPTSCAARPSTEQPAARAVRSAFVSRRGADDFFAHGTADLWAAFAATSLLRRPESGGH